MRRLTLLRHAKSSWDHPELRDIERPLNARGCRDAPLMGRVCAERLPAPDLIICSPSRRTRETIEAFLEGWGLPEPRVIVDDRLYLAGLSDWEEAVEEQASGADHILGCAHQPGVGDFACWLDSSFTGEVPTATVISFLIDGGLRRGCGEVAFYGIPRNYRD